MRKLLGVCLIASLLGCSVKNSNVENRPPELQTDVVQFASEFGDFKIQSATLFLWPDKLNEAQVEEIVKTVNGASEKGDQLKIEGATLLAERAALDSRFKETECVSKWALDTTVNKNVGQVVTAWRASDVAEEAQAIQACAQNQGRRLQILERLDTIVTVEEPTLKATVVMALDPGYPEKIENMKSIDAKGSQFRIRPNETGLKVQIDLKDFLIPGRVQSTEVLDLGRVGEAVYVPQRNLLMFAVPELNADGNPTGLIYRFTLERCPDFAGLARFKGDIKVMNGKKIVRYGSASFEASIEE